MRLPRGVFSLEGRSRLGASTGRSAQASGKEFQHQILTAATYYAARELAQLIEVPVPTFGKPGALKFAGKGAVDFTGFVVSDDGVNVPVIFDAKVTTGKATLSLSFDDPRERQRVAHQVRMLRDWSAMGALAGYLCLDRDAGPDGIVIWVDVAHLLAFDSPQALAGDAPDVPLRSKVRGGGIESPHPWCYLSGDRDVIASRAPRVPWRALVLAGLG